MFTFCLLVGPSLSLPFLLGRRPETVLIVLLACELLTGLLREFGRMAGRGFDWLALSRD